MTSINRIVTSPKATALWFVNNTSLTFQQIANFCGLHLMEVKSIADGVMSKSLREKDPIFHNEVTLEKIEECEKDANKDLIINGYELDEDFKIKIKKKGYVSVSKRQNKPNAILWLHKNVPNITAKEIRSVTGVTKKLVESIIDGSYKHLKDLTPKDPVSLGLCTQLQLNSLIEKLKVR